MPDGARVAVARPRFYWAPDGPAINAGRSDVHRKSGSCRDYMFFKPFLFKLVSRVFVSVLWALLEWMDLELSMIKCELK